jgi:hypothetical protein
VICGEKRGTNGTNIWEECREDIKDRNPVAVTTLAGRSVLQRLYVKKDKWEGISKTEYQNLHYRLV